MKFSNVSDYEESDLKNFKNSFAVIMFVFCTFLMIRRSLSPEIIYFALQAIASFKNNIARQCLFYKADSLKITLP